jgi:CysZ protein
MPPSNASDPHTHPGTGLAAFLGGARFVVTTPSVWPFACVPVLTALALACGLGGLGVSQSGRIARWLLGEEANAAGSWAVTIVAGALLMFLAAVLALALAQPLSGWALEAISRRQEQRLTGRCPPEPSFLRSLWIGVRCSLFIVAAGGLITLVLLPITLVFPPAAVVTVPLKILTAAWFLAWDLIDYPLGLRGRGIRARLRWASANFASFTTFGLLWAAVLLVPGVFLLVLPLGVAGATRLAVASERDDIRDALPT